MALEKELETYQRLLTAELSGQDGRFALIAGSDLLGVYDSYNDALTVGYERCGLAPFLVKKIAAVETIAYFTRDFGAGCTAPA